MSDAGFILNATNELYRIFDALNENYFDGKLQLTVLIRRKRYLKDGMNLME